jgi:predicted nucleic acid-binding protein
MHYWDTSTLLKLYVPEPDSAQFAAHVTTSVIYSSELARWELMRAIIRKEMEQAIPALSAETVFAKFRSDVKAGRVILLPVDGAVETHFRSMVLQLHRRQPAVRIRTADAMHLATAMLLPATELVTTDSQMRDGAKALGLKLFP